MLNALWYILYIYLLGYDYGDITYTLKMHLLYPNFEQCK